MAWTPTEQSERADEFQQTLFEKEKVIKSLEGEVESQVRSLINFAHYFYHRALPDLFRVWVTGILKLEC